jgi:putative hydrolase of the HAD superfamily
MAIRTFMFDLGNVLAFFSHEQMCEQIGRLYGKSAQEIAAIALSEEYGKAWDKGLIDRIEAHRMLNEHFEKEVALADLCDATANIFVPNHTLFPIIESLKAQGYRLVLLSNTCDVHFEFLQELLPILRIFDDFVLSYQVGAVKPEARIFEAALEKINCAPNECFYTDDIPQYIETARTFGILAEVFTTTGNFMRELHRLGIENIL